MVYSPSYFYKTQNKIDMQAWKDYQTKNKDRFLEELLELLRIPSISARTENKADMIKCAEAVKARLLTHTIREFNYSLAICLRTVSKRNLKISLILEHCYSLKEFSRVSYFKQIELEDRINGIINSMNLK